MTYPRSAQPLVSIIIPCYNAEAYVAEAIESALGQAYERTEVIVIDDGSTDGSQEVIRSFGDRVMWRKQENQGAPVARNHGLALTHGFYVKFLDADDVLLEGALAAQVEQSQRLGEHVIPVGEGYYTDATGHVEEELVQRTPREDEDPMAYILGVNLQTSLPLHRRILLEEVEGFDESLPCDQEYDLHMRLCLAGTRFCHFPTDVVRVRRHQGRDRITNQDYIQSNPESWLERIRDRERILRRVQPGELSEEVRRQLAKNAWRGGRLVLRREYPEAAKRYFSYARTLHPECLVSDSRIYPWCVRFFGPVAAERIGSWTRTIRPMAL